MSKENKSILIYYSRFNVGGAERSNLRLMDCLASKGWDVTLLLKYGNGDLEEAIPETVHKICLAGTSYTGIIAEQKNKLKKALLRVRYCIPVLKQRIRAKRILDELGSKKFDIAAVGLQGLDPAPVIKNINASKKLLWIRNDLKLCDKDGRVRKNIEKYGDKIDFFPCVSKTAYESFVSIFPRFKDKAIVLYNVINADEMREKAKGSVPLETRKDDPALKVITVCRISDRAKGIFRMISVYKRLRDEGLFFYWFVVGDGPDLEKAKALVSEKQIGDGFIFLGARENPFPYYKQCDISATLSYYEGLCGTVNEAKITGLPVIATEFSGIHEQIEHGENGWIVENNEEAILDGLRKLIVDEKLRAKLTNDHLPEAIASDDQKEKILLGMTEDHGT